MPKTERSSTLPMRALALVVLLVAAYVLFRVVLSFLSGILFAVVVVVALFAVVWAYRTVKRR